MNTSNTSYFDNITPLDDAQKDQRSALARKVGLHVATLFYVVGGLAFFIVAGVNVVVAPFQTPPTFGRVPISDTDFLVVFFICGLGCLLGGIWLSVTARRNYKQLRAVCGESWRASPWRKLLWSSWLAPTLYIWIPLIVVLGWPDSFQFGTFSSPNTDLLIWAGLSILLIVLLFVLVGLELSLENDLLHWATRNILEGTRGDWGKWLLIAGFRLVTIVFGLDPRKTSDPGTHAVLEVAAAVFAGCGIALAQHRLARLAKSPTA